jgi:hypothetical protein
MVVQKIGPEIVAAAVPPLSVLKKLVLCDTSPPIASDTTTHITPTTTLNLIISLIPFVTQCTARAKHALAHSSDCKSTIG